jgi:hypothetical protein
MKQKLLAKRSLAKSVLVIRFTPGAQAFLMDYLQGERVITHQAGPVRNSWC